MFFPANLLTSSLVRRKEN